MSDVKSHMWASSYKLSVGLSLIAAEFHGLIFALGVGGSDHDAGCSLFLQYF
jgi:hypothetical protein